jgi:uncharacterized membrane protein
MSEYVHTITVSSRAQHIFDFVSNVDNLPRYLPTVKQAMPQGSERVRVKGEAAGQQYDSDGYYRVDNSRKRIEWGSDGENNYRGWLEVKGNSGDATATVTVHLSFEPRPDLAERYDQQTGDRHRTIQDGLENALQSIKYLCEGKGGKIESRVA